MADSSHLQNYAEAGAPGSPEGSPVHINHIPTFLTFANTTDADTDTQGTQDTFSLYVCPGQDDQVGTTDAFNSKDNTCRDVANGILTALCSDTLNGTGDNATCADTQNIVSIPTAHASDYTVKFYVVDSHGFAASVSSQDYTVNDVVPTLTSYTLASTPTMVAASSVSVTQEVVMADNNGDNDITDIDFGFKDPASQPTCTTANADDNDCIFFDITNPASPPSGTYSGTCTISDISSAGSGKTALGTDQTLTLSCDFDVWYNANDANWKINAIATDGNGATGLADSASTTTIPALSAIGVTQSTINYGTLSAGDDSAVQTTDMENAGNQVIDVLLDGDLMTSGGNNIPLVQQEWHHTNSSFTWGTGVTLVDTATTPTDALGCLNRSLVVRIADHTLTTWDESLYWRLRVPSQQASGTYSGTNTFTYTTDGACTDTGA
jgi:hypothetical protein